jgi:hypothetical protein
MQRALIALALLLAGCGTKVLELGHPDAGTVPPFPSKFCLADRDPKGGACTRCFDEWGTPMGGCMALDPPPACFTKQTPAYERCLFCGGEQRSCLKCEPMSLTSSCRRCNWTDGIDKGQGCTQCFDAAGKVLSDDCDDLRPELPHKGP